MSLPVTIAGGGLAGLSLGIGLRKKGVPVTIWEAGEYPRHRVCGEFISGRGQAVLERLGMWQKLIDAGGRIARSLALFSEKDLLYRANLPEPALCVSRFILDDLLAREFSQLGGELRCNSRWLGNWASEGLVRATGRRLQAGHKGWRWIGLKAHARGVALSADLEMHFLPGAYVGFCRLGGERVNVCGLIRTQAAIPDLSERWQEWLRGPDGSPLWNALSAAEFLTESFCAVAGISLRVRRARDLSGECSLGDAVAMIPPVTGNGMSIAFESAEAAVPWIVQYSAGELDWERVREEVAAQYDRQFSKRLHQAGLLHSLVFQRPSIRRMFFSVLRSRWCVEGMFRHSR